MMILFTPSFRFVPIAENKYVRIGCFMPYIQTVKIRKKNQIKYSNEISQNETHIIMIFQIVPIVDDVNEC